MRGLVPFAAAVLLCGAIVTVAGQAPAQPPPGAPAQPPAAEAAVPEWLPTEFKNLKILPKDIEPKQLLVVMRGFTQAMGVRCVYCHVAGPDPSDMSSYNFDSDRKEHKETTRAMLKYTEAVNEAFPKGVGEEPKAGEQRVTCGHDPTSDFEDARRSLSDVLEANPICAEAAAERGHLELSWGRYRTKVVDRRGAHDHYANAVRFFEEAMKMNDSLSGSLRDWHREARRGMLGAY